MAANQNHYPGTLVFHKMIRKTMLMCRFAGVLPLSGLFDETSYNVRFQLKCFYSIIYVPCMLFWILRVPLFLYECLDKSLSLRRASSFIFLSNIFVSSVLLLRLCSRWKSMVDSIEDIEELLPPMRESKFYIQLCNICTFMIMALGAVEHALYIGYMYEVVIDCFSLPDDDGLYLKSLHLAVNAWAFDKIPFDYVIGFILQLLLIQATFVWNFVDVLIMGFCIYLIAQIRNFNHVIVEMKDKTKQINWSEIQIHFTRIGKLIKIVNDHINSLVFVSFCSNLFFICQQLFYLINKNYIKGFSVGGDCAIDDSSKFTVICIYLLFSLVFLLARILLVSLLAAEVHKICKKCLPSLHNLPSSVYNAEMQRFMDQVYYCKYGLSGMNFFFVTRGMILSVGATIVTYELVLLQIQLKTE